MVWEETRDQSVWASSTSTAVGRRDTGSMMRQIPRSSLVTAQLSSEEGDKLVVG